MLKIHIIINCLSEKIFSNAELIKSYLKLIIEREKIFEEIICQKTINKLSSTKV